MDKLKLKDRIKERIQELYLTHIKLIDLLKVENDFRNRLKLKETQRLIAVNELVLSLFFGEFSEELQ